MRTVKCKRICAGYYQTTNTTPVADIAKSVDHEGMWTVSYGDYHGRWGSKRECLDLIESVHNDYTPDDHDHWIDIDQASDEEIRVEPTGPRAHHDYGC